MRLLSLVRSAACRGMETYSTFGVVAALPLQRKLLRFSRICNSPNSIEARIPIAGSQPLLRLSRCCDGRQLRLSRSRCAVVRTSVLYCCTHIGSSPIHAPSSLVVALRRQEYACNSVARSPLGLFPPSANQTVHPNRYFEWIDSSVSPYPDTLFIFIHLLLLSSPRLPPLSPWYSLWPTPSCTQPLSHRNRTLDTMLTFVLPCSAGPVLDALRTQPKVWPSYHGAAV